MTSRPHPLTGPRGWRSALLVTIAAGLFVTFWLPTRFPPPIAFSESYEFGFNNRLCLLLFLSVIAATAIFTKLGGLKLPESGRQPTEGFGGLSGKVLALFMGIGAALCGFLFWLTYSLGGINDTSYFLDRIHLMQRGLVPFRDFEWVYGIGPLYGSLALGRLLHTSPDFGYYLLWVTSTLLGIFVLWVSIRWMDTLAGGKRTVFVLVSVFMLLLTLLVTMNYSALRYTLPLFAIAGFCRIDGDAHLPTRMAALLFAVGMAALLLSFSPEEGLAYTVAICIYLPVRRYYARRPFIPDLVLLLVAAAGLFLAVAHAGTFATMKRFGAGAFNLPIYPAPHILFAFAVVLGLVFYVMSGKLAVRSQSTVAFATLYSIGMLPGALGRCETTHVLGYLLPAFVSALLLAWLWLPLWRIAVVAFAIIFLVLPKTIDLISTSPEMTKAFLNHLYGDGVPRGGAAEKLDHLATRLAVRMFGPQVGLEKMNALRNAAAASSVDPHQVFPGASPMVAAPFQYLPNKLNNYHGPTMDEGYFMGLLSVVTPQEVERKIEELRVHPEEDLVVSYAGFTDCAVRVGNRAQLRDLMLLPWVPKPRNDWPVLVPLCDYVNQNYTFVVLPSSATFSYGLMRRKPIATPQGRATAKAQ